MLYYPHKLPKVWRSMFHLHDSSKVQVAPQETEISSYKIGARDTEISDEAFEDFNL
jgi:hypothetical protein